MRLKASEIESILHAFSELLADKDRVLKLYGSRVNDSLKGGDIDLVLICKDLSSLPPKHIVLASLKKTLGDRKIDLSFITHEKAKDPFWVEALKCAIELP